MMIPDPWNTPKIRKIGLFSMYVIDAVMESLEIIAEKDPAVKLIDPNPVYEKITSVLSKLIQLYLKNKPEEERLEKFTKFYILALEHSNSDKSKSNVVYWDGMIPDVRALGGVDDSISWVYSVLVKDTKP